MIFSAAHRRNTRDMLARRPVRFALALVAFGLLHAAGLSTQPPRVVGADAYVAAPSDPRYLSEMDRALYTAIFDALRRNEQDTVDTLLSQVDNQILLGHVLAVRYMRPNYDASADELMAWLQNYGDHPEAGRIATLANTKGADLSMLPTIDQSAPLKGDGAVFHMGRSTMPDSWYRGLRLWKEGEFAAAARLFTTVGDSRTLNGWQRAAGYYWAYRSLLQNGKRDEAADQLALAAAHPLTFYGQLALAREGRDLPVQPAAPYISYRLRNDPHVLRASALSALEMDEAAEVELRSLYHALNTTDRAGLMAVAAEMNLPNLQLRLARQKGLSDAAALFGSYPAPAPMIEAAQDIVPPALVLAVARHESGFRDEAKSSAGALGMMQMLPSTAKAVLQQSELQLADADDSLLPIAKRLNDARTSTQIGAAYLHMLTQQRAIGDNLMKMLAGYNAGPGAVANWNKTARNLSDPLLYMESIPYPETHNYVMQVLAHYWIYQTMMGERPASLQALAHGEWPRIS